MPAGQIVWFYWWSILQKDTLSCGPCGQYAFLIPAKRLIGVITSLPDVDDDVNVPIEQMIGEIVDPVVATAN